MNLLGGIDRRVDGRVDGRVDRRPAAESSMMPGAALRGKRLFEPTPPRHEQQQLVPIRSAEPSPINVLRQLHALHAEHSGMKAKHARLIEDNTRLNADNTRLHTDITRLAAQAARAEHEARAERQRSASLQSRVDAEATAGQAAVEQLQEGLALGQELRGALAQEQEALAQELQLELGREIERSRGLQDEVEALRESAGQLEQRCAESEASLRRVCSEREQGFAASLERVALRSSGVAALPPPPQPPPPPPPFERPPPAAAAAAAASMGPRAAHDAVLPPLPPLPPPLPPSPRARPAATQLAPVDQPAGPRGGRLLPAPLGTAATARPPLPRYLVTGTGKPPRRGRETDL